MKPAFPRTVFGGRVRTTTLLLIAVFIGLMLAYGQAEAHYQKQDEDKARRAAEQYVPRSTQPSELETYPTTTRPTKRSSSQSSSTSTTTAPDSTQYYGPDQSSPSPSSSTPVVPLAPGFSIPVPRIP